MGINAISQLLMLLDFVFENNSTKVPLLDLFTKYIGLDYNGTALNINFPDESGELTLNVGNFYFENNNLAFNKKTADTIISAIYKNKTLIIRLRFQ